MKKETPEQRQERLHKKKLYRERNKEAIQVYQKQYRDNKTDEEKELRSIQNKEYLQKYKPIRNKNRVNRYNSDENFNIETRYRRLMWGALRGHKKSNKTISYLGCSTVEFVRYLESKFLEGMTWENRKEWHIDHIIPCCAFDLTKEEELKECFHYKNFRPLWAKDNINKIKEDLQWKKLKQLKQLKQLRTIVVENEADVP